ncbi:MAG: P-loop NTPase fold protein, partial [Chloroflexota bacterium]|nr:P-loop NTPase fold protein [Chloroflexota bacterium]
MTDKTYILGDLPAERDALDFQPYIDTLADVVSSPNTQTPLTIGVFGGWGSGKTTLMGLVRQGLPPNYRTAWFDAWKYERETDLWRALLLTVLDALETALPKNESNEVDSEAKGRLDDLRTSLYRPVEREEMGGLQVDWGELAGGLGQGVLQIGLSFVPGASTLADMVKALQKEGATTGTEKIIEAIGRERSQIFIKQVQFLEEFQREFRDLVQTYVVEKKHRLVVFVDDLDRCLPEKAVEVLEAIKLFLDVPGCVFMLGLDDKVIARGIEIKYRQAGLTEEETGTDREQRLIEGSLYLEKIIQLPFQLPPIAQDDMSNFVTGLVKDWQHAECPKVFAAGLGGNPRRVKRTVNTFLLLHRLAEKRGGDINAVRLAKVVAIQNAFPRLYEFLKEDRHRYLRELEIYFLAEA